LSVDVICNLLLRSAGDIEHEGCEFANQNCRSNSSSAGEYGSDFQPAALHTFPNDLRTDRTFKQLLKLRLHRASQQLVEFA